MQYKYLIFFLCLCLFLVSCPTLPQSQANSGENLLLNGDFEAGNIHDPVPGWGIAPLNNVLFTVEREGENLENKIGVLTIGTVDNWGYTTQWIPFSLDKTKVANFSFWARTDGNQIRIAPTVSLNFPQQKRNDFAVVQHEYIITDNWTKCEVEIDFLPLVYPPDLSLDDATLRVMIHSNPGTKLWIDNASLIIKDGDPNKRKWNKGIAVPNYAEAGMITLSDGKSVAVFYLQTFLYRRISPDGGVTWLQPDLVFTSNNQKITDVWKISIIRLKDSRLGMFSHMNLENGGRAILFSTSNDEGLTWTDPIQINEAHPNERGIHNGSPIVLENGRIVAPAFYYLDPSYGLDQQNTPGPQCSTGCWISDDNGQTWTKGNEVTIYHDVTIPGESEGILRPTWFEEAVAVELKDGRLLLLGRTPFGKIFKSYSNDQGLTWSTPEPTSLASSYSPCAISRIPLTGNLVVVWNQNSLEEDQKGLRRHRLTLAISADDGMRWKYHRNIESLDNIVSMSRDLNWDVFSYDHEPPFHQPDDISQYPFAPGILRCSYPVITFAKDAFVVSYDYGCTPGILESNNIKVKSIPIKEIDP